MPHNILHSLSGLAAGEKVVFDDRDTVADVEDAEIWSRNELLTWTFPSISAQLLIVRSDTL